MENFPVLEVGQVALFRAKLQTGHILDETFSVVNNDGQMFYTIFNSLSEAFDCARKIVLEKDWVECTILGTKKEILYHLNKMNIGSVQSPKE